MKILFVITKATWGGAQRYLYDLLSAAPKDITTLVAYGEEGLLQKKLSELTLPLFPIPSLQKEVHPIRDLHALFSLIQLIRKEKPDCIQSNSSKAGFIAGVAAVLTGTPHIFTCHGWSFAEPRSLLTKSVFFILHTLTVWSSHKVVCVSHALTQAPLPGLKKKAVVVYNGITPPSYRDKEGARALILPSLQEDKKTARLIIGTIAELTPVKGIRYGIDAVKELIEHGYPVLYIIIGDGQEREELQHYIEQEELTSSIQLVGFKESASHYVKAFDIFLLPSLSESFGYVIAEAGLAEVPVVSTNVGGIPEVVDPSTKDTLVPPRSATLLAHALRQLIEQPLLRTQYGKALARHISTLFTLENMRTQTFALLRETSRKANHE